jgi:dsDNA-specific endonuclease/ATPase MutS2
MNTVFERSITSIESACKAAVSEVSRLADTTAHILAERHTLEALRQSSRTEEQRVEAFRKEASECQSKINDATVRALNIVAEANRKADRAKKDAEVEAAKIVQAAKDRVAAAHQSLST